MKEYYLHDGQDQIGPFSVDELKARNLTGETYIWKDGLTDWVKASEVPGLSGLFVKTPPPFKAAATAPLNTIAENKYVQESSAQKKGRWIRRNLKLISFITILLLIAGTIVYNKQQNGVTSSTYAAAIPERVKTPEELRIELKEQEKQNPAEYLDAKITVRENLIGEKVFEGSITNKASAATFKDVVLKVQYMSKTNSVIREEKFTIYEIIGPQQTVSIKKIKTFAPSGTEGYSTGVISALPVE